MEILILLTPTLSTKYSKERKIFLQERFVIQWHEILLIKFSFIRLFTYFHFIYLKFLQLGLNSNSAITFQ